MTARCRRVWSQSDTSDQSGSRGDRAARAVFPCSAPLVGQPNARLTGQGSRYAEGLDEVTGRYLGLLWQRAPIGPMPEAALLVRPEVAMTRLRPAVPAPLPETGPTPLEDVTGPVPPIAPGPTPNQQPRRFYGSVEIDIVRPVKAFDAILNAVVMELLRGTGAKVRLTLEIEADAEDGFSEADIGVVRDDVPQLKFKAESTGFE